MSGVLSGSDSTAPLADVTRSHNGRGAVCTCGSTALMEWFQTSPCIAWQPVPSIEGHSSSASDPSKLPATVTVSPPKFGFDVQYAAAGATAAVSREEAADNAATTSRQDISS